MQEHFGYLKVSYKIQIFLGVLIALWAIVFGGVLAFFLTASFIILPYLAIKELNNYNDKQKLLFNIINALIVVFSLFLPLGIWQLYMLYKIKDIKTEEENLYLQKYSKEKDLKIFKRLPIFIPSIVIGVILFIFLGLQIVFLDAQKLYSNYKTSGIIVITLILVFSLLYMLIKFKEKIYKILFIFTAICITLPFVYSFIMYSNIVHKKETNYYVLKKLPSGLHITEVLYKKSKRFGIGGPGDMEEGFYVFKLPDDIAKKVNLNFLKNLHNTNKEFEPYKYGTWQQTPIMHNFKSYPYLKKDFRFSFIYIDNQVLKNFQDSIANKRSYYIHQGGGATLVISPKKKVVFYVYKN